MFARLSESMFGESRPSPHIGRFRLVRRLGAGGMGVVYEARDETLDRRVAIKLLHHPHGVATRGHVLAEAKALAMLSHPNVVHVYEVGTHRGMRFIAMEHVEGTTLARWQEAERPRWPAIVAAYVQAGQALAAAHRVGLVHRDFKPSNALIDHQGRVRVLDFGLARTMENATTDASPFATPPPAEQTDAIAGTLAFMSPEQLRRDLATPASDQFSFCVALFLALTGQLPFAGETPELRLRALQDGRMAPFRAAHPIPRWLRRAILRGLELDPLRRFSTMEALLERLERPLPQRRWPWVAGLGVLTSVTVALAPYHAAMWCQGDDALAGAWDGSIARRVRDRFLGTEHPEALTIAAAVTDALDAHAGRWHDAQATACETLDQQHERLACLDVARQELAALSALLQQPDHGIVTHASEMVVELPSADDCSRAVRSRAAPPPPSIAAEVMRQRARLVEARLQRISGRHAQARALLTVSYQTARRLGHDPLLAEVLLEQARVEERAGNREDALVRLEAAKHAALSSNHAEVEVDARLLAARILVSPLEQLERAQRELQAARARTHALPPRLRRDGHLHLVEGMIALAAEDLQTARRELEQALATFRGMPEPNRLDIAEALIPLGNVASDEGRTDDALVYYHQVLELREQILGPRHPLVGLVHYDIATVRAERGELELAERAYTDAMERLVLDEPSGSYGMEIAGIKIERANLLMARNEHHEAIQLALAADRMLADDYPPTHSQRVAARQALCHAYSAANALEPALECYRQLLGLHHAGVARLDPTSLQIDIGDTLVALGWDDEARAHYERVLPERAFQADGRASHATGRMQAAQPRGRGVVGRRHLGRRRRAGRVGPRSGRGLGSGPFGPWAQIQPRRRKYTSSTTAVPAISASANG
jgi:eukaryotic-like serine/threonine-protein kinase